MTKSNYKGEKIVSKSLKQLEQTCEYSELRDCMAVVPNLGVDINDMLQTGIVKDSGETLDNNGIDDPSKIIGRVRDTFDALDASRIIKKYGKNSAKANDAVQTATQSDSND